MRKNERKRSNGEKERNYLVVSISSLILHFLSLSISSLYFSSLYISSFIPHFLAGRLPDCHKLWQPGREEKFTLHCICFIWILDDFSYYHSFNPATNNSFVKLYCNVIEVTIFRLQKSSIKKAQFFCCMYGI